MQIYSSLGIIFGGKLLLFPVLRIACTCLHVRGESVQVCVHIWVRSSVYVNVAESSLYWCKVF